MLQIQGILLQYLKFNKPIFTCQTFYITFKIQHIISFSRYIRPFVQPAQFVLDIKAEQVYIFFVSLLIFVIYETIKPNFDGIKRCYCYCVFITFMQITKISLNIDWIIMHTTIFWLILHIAGGENEILYKIYQIEKCSNF